jgi:hypothetical protein
MTGFCSSGRVLAKFPCFSWRCEKVVIYLQRQNKYERYDYDFCILVVALLKIETVVSRLTIGNH